MAVRAPDFALVNFRDQLSQRPPQELVSDVELLVAHVVELENERIGFAAIDARMGLEISNEEGETVRTLLQRSSARSNDISGLVLDVMCTALLACTGTS